MFIGHANLSDLNSRPTTATLRGLPPGREGTIETLKHMRDFVRASIRDTNLVIRRKAMELVGDQPARDWLREIRTLHAFVRDRIRYIRDPIDDVELVQSPEKTLEFGQGDCDDKATLLAALLASIGHPVMFVAVGLNGGPFSHVLVETKHNDKWIAAETIIPKPLGWFPPGVTQKYRLKVQQ